MSKKLLMAGLLAGCHATSEQPTAQNPEYIDSPQVAPPSIDYQKLKAEEKKVLSDLQAASKTSKTVGACATLVEFEDLLNEQFWKDSVQGICEIPKLEDLREMDDPYAYLEQYEQICANLMIGQKGQTAMDFLNNYYERKLLTALRIQSCSETLKGLSTPIIDEQVIRLKVAQYSKTTSSRKTLTYKKRQLMDEMKIPYAKGAERLPNFMGPYGYIENDLCGKELPELKTCLDNNRKNWVKFKQDHQAEIAACNAKPPIEDPNFEDSENPCPNWIAQKHPDFYQKDLQEEMICQEIQNACLEQVSAQLTTNNFPPNIVK